MFNRKPYTYDKRYAASRHTVPELVTWALHYGQIKLEESKFPHNYILSIAFFHDADREEFERIAYSHNLILTEQSPLTLDGE